MLLTISTTYQPATHLGYLLHKNPARLQSIEVAGGQAHIFYPEATVERCTVALLLDLDPIGLGRGRSGGSGEGFDPEQHVNDRPYVASSFLSAALSKAFGTALNGTCKDRSDLPTEALPPTMPGPMRELSPYPEVYALHLHGFFRVDSGTFRLRPLPGGRTLLEARTVYRHAIGPQFYWQLWSDYLLDAKHGQVLATLKAEAEASVPHE